MALIRRHLTAWIGGAVIAALVATDVGAQSAAVPGPPDALILTWANGMRSSIRVGTS